jgi:hypothetical protein
MSRFTIGSHSAKTARRSGTRVRLAAAAAACIGLVAAATPAWATTNTITVGPTADLTVKVAISVPVSIVCDPLTDAFYVSSSVSVSVKQANGKQISSASGILYGDGSMLICDGSTQNNIVMKVMPDPGSGPFKNGAAYATASFTYGDPMGGVADSGNTGGAIKLH